MSKELEIKIETTFENYIKIKSFLEEKAERIVDKEQKDIYYSPAGIDFYNHGDRCLRMRIEDKKAVLSYKRIHDENKSSRFIEEYETRIENSQIMDKILSALNFEKIIVIRKKRCEYKYKDSYLVALDIVEGLGYFVEIENRKEEDSVEKRNYDLMNIAKTFDLKMDNINTEGYSNMLYRKSRSIK